MPPSRIWFAEHNIALLAWLDYTLENNIDFNATIVDHLIKATGKEFVISQVTTRLENFIRDERVHCVTPVTCVHFKRTGSRSLRSLDKDTRKQVDMLAQGYTAEDVPHYRKITPKKPTVGSQLAHTGSETPIFQQALAAKTGRGPNGGLALKKTNPGTTELQDSDETVSRLLKSTTRTSAEDRKSSKPPSVKVQRFHTSHGGSPLGSSDHARTTDARSSNGIPLKNTQSSSKILSRAATQKNHQAEVRRLEAEINAVRAQWHHEAEIFDEKDKRRKQIEIDLRAQITHLNFARQDRQNAGKNPLEGVLFMKDEEIWHLKQKNHEMQSLAGFAQSLPEQTVPVSPDDIPAALEAIESELHSILQGHDLDVPLLRPSVQEHADLALLLQTFSSENTVPSQPTQQLLSNALKWGTVLLIRSLTVAALQHWVFTTDFPNLCRSGDPQMLLAYRKAILVHDGWDSLRNLELAAYSAILDDDTFKKGVVSRKAEQLAVRLSKALAPLFSRSPDTQANTVSETWNQPIDVCEDRRFRFKDLFEAALNLKATTTITYDKYEFVVHPPGISVNRITDHGVRVVDLQKPQAEDSDHEPEKWLHATIFVYNGEPAFPPDPMSDALVQSTNFVTHSSSDKRLHCQSKYDLTIEKSQDTDIYVFDEPMTFATSSPDRWGARLEGVKRSRNEPDQSTNMPPNDGAPQKRLKLIHLQTMEEATTKSDKKGENESHKGRFRPETRSDTLKKPKARRNSNQKSDPSSNDLEVSEPESAAPSQQLQCENCCQTFQYEACLKKHRDKSEEVTDRYVDSCTSRELDEVSNKTKNRPSQRPPTCDICVRTFSKTGNLALHQNRGTCSRTLLEESEQIPMPTSPRKTARQRKTDTGEFFLSAEVDSSSSDRHASAIDDHTPSNSKRAPKIAVEVPTCGLNCPRCRALFKSVPGLNRHVKHKVCRQCPTCGEWCRDSHAMIQHQKDEHDSPIFPNDLQKRPHTSSHPANTKKDDSPPSQGSRGSIAVVLTSFTSKQASNQGDRSGQTMESDACHQEPENESDEGLLDDDADMPLSRVRNELLVGFASQGAHEKRLHAGESILPSASSRQFLAVESSLTFQESPQEEDSAQDQYTQEEAQARVSISSIPGAQKVAISNQRRHSLVRNISSSDLTASKMPGSDGTIPRLSCPSLQQSPKHQCPSVSRSVLESSESDIFLEIPTQQVLRSANPSPSPPLVPSPLPPQSALSHNAISTEFDYFMNTLESEAPPDLNIPGATPKAIGGCSDQDRIWASDVDMNLPDKFDSMLDDADAVQSEDRADSVEMVQSMTTFEPQNARPDSQPLTGFGNNATSGLVQSSRFSSFLGMFGGTNVGEEMSL